MDKLRFCFIFVTHSICVGSLTAASLTTTISRTEKISAERKKFAELHKTLPSLPSTQLAKKGFDFANELIKLYERYPNTHAASITRTVREVEDSTAMQPYITYAFEKHTTPAQNTLTLAQNLCFKLKHNSAYIAALKSKNLPTLISLLKNTATTVSTLYTQHPTTAPSWSDVTTQLSLSELEGKALQAAMQKFYPTYWKQIDQAMKLSASSLPQNIQSEIRAWIQNEAQPTLTALKKMQLQHDTILQKRSKIQKELDTIAKKIHESEPAQSHTDPHSPAQPPEYKKCVETFVKLFQMHKDIAPSRILRIIKAAIDLPLVSSIADDALALYQKEERAILAHLAAAIASTKADHSYFLALQRRQTKTIAQSLKPFSQVIYCIYRDTSPTFSWEEMQAFLKMTDLEMSIISDQITKAAKEAGTFNLFEKKLNDLSYATQFPLVSKAKPTITEWCQSGEGYAALSALKEAILRA